MWIRHLAVFISVVTRVTEQQTGVSTAGFELLLTHGAAGVRSQPGVSWRILQFSTVTHVPEHNTGHILANNFDNFV